MSKNVAVSTHESICLHNQACHISPWNDDSEHRPVYSLFKTSVNAIQEKEYTIK